MAEPLRCVAPDSVVAGWDFSTGTVKCLAFDLDGRTLAEVRLPTDLWTEGGVSELNLMQLEGQARAAVRLLAARLRDLGPHAQIGERVRAHAVARAAAAERHVRCAQVAALPNPRVDF